MVRPGFWWVGLIFWLNLPASSFAASDPDEIAFFEAKIRPVLVRECYACHAAGAKSIKGGLRLDSRAAVLAGGESGAVLVPGKPEASRLLDALRYEGLEMPPRGKLPDAVIADFTRWIQLGAPDPREGPTSARTGSPSMDLKAGRRFWAYQPPRLHRAPPLKDARWPLEEIDAFILAGLEAKGLRPGPDADRVTLARRLAYDLTGLPLAPVEVNAFVADARPDAYERLVDRLLASPAFGERWGRHWLDVARFAESLTLRGFVFPNAWRYRDYVIHSFNRDAGFDRFLREQVAGDLLPSASLSERRDQLIATTFLMLGNTNLEEQDKRQLDMDVVDEQLDTIGKAVLAQTLGCARCHDHKFDPIPTQDYYALAGILASTKALEHTNVSKWLDVSLPLPPAEEEAAAQAQARAAEVEALLKKQKPRLAQSGKAAQGVLAVTSAPGVVIDDARARKVGSWTTSTFSGNYIGAGYLHDDNASKGEKTLTFQPDLPEAGPYEVWLAYSPGANRSSKVPVTILSADGEATVHVDMKAPPAIAGRYVSLGRYRFEKNGQGFVMITTEGTTGHVTADAVCFVPPGKTQANSAEKAGGSVDLRKLEDELKRWKAVVSNRPAAMTVVERPKPSDVKVHIRGSVHTLGNSVSRGFLQVATLGPAPAIPTNQSGRKELAQWLGSDRNPLTARVFVNRSWHWLFGAGLVRTTDNFGTTGEPPSHPELLDTLATQFAGEDEWSVKKLVRRIVLSRTYRLASVDAAGSREATADPENRLLWRQNRRRLDAECIRDTMLSVSGVLRRDMGGPGFPADLSADYDYKDVQTRRSVYVPVFRNAMPGVVRGGAGLRGSEHGRGASQRTARWAPQRSSRNDHQLEQGRSRALRRLLSRDEPDTYARVAVAYRWALGRAPTNGEREQAAVFVAGADVPSEDARSLLFQGLVFFGRLSIHQLTSWQRCESRRLDCVSTDHAA
ncbi:MAG: DUF1549 domain-containing protein [Isosphaeraceae bacterium]